MTSRLLARVLLVLLLLVPTARAARVNFAGDSPPTSTFAALPSCSSTNRPSRIITDANTNTPGDTITAGGAANVVTADCDGTVWKVRGGSGSGSGAFSAVTSGTNTTAAMVIGTGASLTTTGSGSINATFAAAATSATSATTASALAANGANCSAGQYPLGVNASGAVEGCTPAATGVVETLAGDAFIVVDDTDPANLLMSLDTAQIVRKDTASIVSSTIDVTGGLGIPNGTSCTSTTAGRLCADTDGITGFAGDVLSLRASGAQQVFPGFTSLGAAGVANLFGKNASDAPTPYPIATAPTADAVPLANGSGKIDGGWLLGVANGGTVAERQSAAISANVVPVSDGAKLVETPVTIVDGVLHALGAVFAAGGVASKTYFASAYGLDPSLNVKVALECSTGVGSTTAAFNTDSTSVTHVSKVCPISDINTFTMGTLTLRLGTLATPANFVADELFSWSIYLCPALTPGSGPDNTLCTLVDRAVAENDSTPETTYGTGRTARPCLGQGCTVSIPLDGNGLSPAGDTDVAAGAFDFFMIVYEADAPSDCTNGGAVSCTTWDSDGDGGGADAGSPGVSQWTAHITAHN